MSRASGSLTKRYPWLVVAGAALTYALAYIALYRTGALGQTAVLDEVENVRLARALLSGSYPWDSPRLYPVVLALGGVISQHGFFLKLFAQLVNILLHVANALLIAGIARQVWGDRTVSLAAGLVWAVFPVAVYFTGEALDTTFSLTLLLALIYSFGRTLDRRPSMGDALACAALVAALWFARPQLVLVALIPAACWAVQGAWNALAAYTVAAVTTVLAAGSVVWMLTGAMSVTPVQTGYTLWGAHGPEANGLYFRQVREVTNEGDGYNPAAREGMMRYREAFPETPVSPAGISAYWTGKTLEHVASRPLDWLMLTGHKALSAVGNWEPYNNKTYAFHKERSPVLRYNPLAFVLLLAPAVVALVLARRRPGARALLIAALCVWMSVLLTFASARFRLPLAAILAVAAPAAWVAWSGEHALVRRRLAVAAALCMTLVSLAYPRIYGHPETRTEDWMLVASANHKLGRSEDAREAVERALKLRPGYPKALAARCNILFSQQMNRWRGGETAVSGEVVEACALASAHSPASRWGYGVLLLRSGKPRHAAELWRTLYDSGSAERARALAGLIFIGAMNPGEASSSDLPAMTSRYPLLGLALREHGNPAPALEPGHGQDDAAFYRWLFSTPSAGSAGE